jgi:hypothetical protein
MIATVLKRHRGLSLRELIAALDKRTLEGSPWGRPYKTNLTDMARITEDLFFK